MNERDHEQADSLRKLRTLLSAAGYTHRPGGRGRRQMTFGGRLREWVLHAHLSPYWFHTYSTVCALPPEPGLRSELLLWLMRRNASLALLKYSVTPSDLIVLECEIRSEKLDADEVRNLVAFLHATAEEDYLPLLRVATGDARLDALSQSFSRDSSTTGDVAS